jgi:NAD(P)H dehydrogenase (quinone)
MKIALTAATGQLGARVIEALLGSGVTASDIVAGARIVSKASALTECGIDVRQADYDAPKTLATAFSGVERLLLIPTMAPPAPRVIQHQAALDAAREAGVKHISFFGIAGTSPEVPSALMPFLLYAESAVRNSGMAWTILRNCFYADPIVEWVDDIVKMGTIPYPTANGATAYVARADIARAAAAVLTGESHDGKIYNLTGPERMTTADLCRAVATATGKPVEDRNASDDDYRAIAGDQPPFMTAVLLGLYHGIRDGYYDVLSNDIETLTGKAPQRFEEQVRQHYQQPE